MPQMYIVSNQCGCDFAPMCKQKLITFIKNGCLEVGDTIRVEEVTYNIYSEEELEEMNNV